MNFLLSNTVNAFGQMGGEKDNVVIQNNTKLHFANGKRNRIPSRHSVNYQKTNERSSEKGSNMKRNEKHKRKFSVSVRKVRACFVQGLRAQMWM